MAWLYGKWTGESRKGGCSPHCAQEDQRVVDGKAFHIKAFHTQPFDACAGKDLALCTARGRFKCQDEPPGWPENTLDDGGPDRAHPEVEIKVHGKYRVKALVAQINMLESAKAGRYPIVGNGQNAIDHGLRSVQGDNPARGQAVQNEPYGDAMAAPDLEHILGTVKVKGRYSGRMSCSNSHGERYRAGQVSV